MVDGCKTTLALMESFARIAYLIEMVSQVEMKVTFWRLLLRVACRIISMLRLLSHSEPLDDKSGHFLHN